MNRRIWIKILAFIAALYVSYTGTKHLGNHTLAQNDHPQTVQAEQQTVTNQNAVNDSSKTSDNHQEFKDHSEVTGNGVVIKILSDDNKAGGDNGSRHQRFLLKLPSGQTVLVVHNIDLAPRLELLSEGDMIVFKGVYISNDKGGLIHWTHRDPNERHEDGWLKRNGRIYQ